MLVVRSNTFRRADAQGACWSVIGDIDAVGLHEQVVEVSAAHPDTQRTVGVQRALRSLKLDMDPGVAGLPIRHDLYLAVRSVVLAIRCLQNEGPTLGEPHLEGGDRLVLDL